MVKRLNKKMARKGQNENEVISMHYLTFSTFLSKVYT